MVLPEIIRVIQTSAEEIAGALYTELRGDVRTRFLRGMSEEEAKRRVRDLYANLASWIGAPDEGGVAELYRALGQARAEEGVMASELVWAITRAKTHLLDFIRRNDLIESSVEAYFENELMDEVHAFFDRATYHTLRGYEAAGVRPHASGASHVIAAMDAGK